MKTKISALMDGELDERSAREAIVTSVPGLSPGTQVVVYDRSDKTFVRVDLGPQGTQQAGDGIGATLSGNGRFVLLTTRSKLVASDTDNRYDVYLRDTQAGTTVLVGVGNEEQDPTSSDIVGVGVSNDGNVVAIEAPGGPGFAGDYQTHSYLRYRSLGTTVLVADQLLDLTPDGTKYITVNPVPTVFYNDESTYVDLRAVSDRHLIRRFYMRYDSYYATRNLMISDDAKTITYSGWLTSIINTETGVVTPSSKNYNASTSNGSNPTLSVLFQSSPEPYPISAWNPTTGYTNVNITSDGTPANGSNVPNAYNYSYVTQDGRYVVFSSIATNLVPGLPNNSNGRVFIFDLQA